MIICELVDQLLKNITIIKLALLEIQQFLRQKEQLREALDLFAFLDTTLLNSKD